MSQYKFNIGQPIKFRFSGRTRSAASGSYEIVGYQPDEDGERRYRIKSDLEKHERIAREIELSEIA